MTDARAFNAPLSPQAAGAGWGWILAYGILSLVLGVLAFLVYLRPLAANPYARGVGLGALLPVVFVFGFVPPRWIALWPILGNIHHIDADADDHRFPWG